MRTVSAEQRGTDTRQRIIEAVWEVLAENGLPGLTVRLVGQKAGISHAMVHYYFSSKDELVLAVVEHARGYWIHPMEDIAFGPGSPLEKLETVVTWMAELATRDVMRVHGQLLSQSEWNEDLRTAMAAEYARWRAAFIELFRQLDEAETLTEGTDVKLLGAAFASLSDHLVDEQALDSRLDTQAIMREALRPFLRVPVKPTIGGAERLPAAAGRTRPRRARRGR